MTTWRSVLAAQFFAPEFWSRRERRSGLCGAICRSPTKWRASGAHDPEKWRPVFGQDHAQKRTGKRSAERRIVQPCPHRQTSLRNSSVRGVRTVFCSAPTFRRSRSRHSPPATTPMAQLQNRVSRGVGWRVFCPLRQKVPRLSTLRADRSLCRSTGDPKPPGSGLAKRSARGHRTSHSLLRHAVPERRPAQSEVIVP